MINPNELFNKPEYAFLGSNPHLGDNIILVGLGGSYAYGTNIETSDIDIRGIATRTADEILLGNDFEEVVKNEVDVTVYSLDKMIKLLSNCNPNCIELLGLRPDDYLYKTEAGELLLNNKTVFLSKYAIKTFGGYATQQLYRLQQKTLSALTPEEFNSHIAKVINNMSDHLSTNYGITGVHVKESDGELLVDIDDMKDISIDAFYGINNEISNVIKEYNKTSKRNNHAIEHGKINKHAMHLIRLYMMCIDILEKHEIITYREDEHDLLMDIRNGKFSSEDGLMNSDFFDLLKEYEEKFDRAKCITTLPDYPNREEINKLQKAINMSVVTKGILDKYLESL